MSEPSTAPRPRMPSAAFVALQLVLLGAAVGAAAYRVRIVDAPLALPALRSAPLGVGPTYDYDVVVSDEQLRRVLLRLRPVFEGDKTRINHVDHALRFWTAAAEFDDPRFMSGEDMRRLLTDHRRFAEVYGPERKPLLIDEPAGVDVREREGPASASHVDHTLAGLAEVGTPLDFPLTTPTRQTTYRAMLEQSLREFSLNQDEYEWSALTYVLYLPPVRSWITTEGQAVSFDRIAERIMREDLPQGVCLAHHRMHALVMFLRVDDETPILSPEVRQRIVAYLQGVTQALVRNQHPDGFWNIDWPFSPAKTSEPTDAEGDRLSDRIIATGHPLEWWALAPEEIHPPRHVLAAAGQWLVRTVDGLSDEQIGEHFTFLSHAGRALALWRGKTPPEVLAAPAE